MVNLKDEESSSSAAAVADLAPTSVTTLPEPTTESPPAPAAAVPAPVAVATETIAAIPALELPADDNLDVDADDVDSAYGADDSISETTSLASSMYRGYIENGRRYQTLRDSEYWGPSDEQQFETMEAGHLLYKILDCQEENQLFRSPISPDAQHIIDLGTGDGTWAIEVADNHPGITVHGVDLFPPPTNWVPPNCILELDDITQEWTWRNKFDLIHMRLLLGAFTPDEWDSLYARCYNHLAPGGWIEQVELDVRVMSDDGSLVEGSLLHGWGPNFLACAERSGRPLNTQLTMRDKIAAAGFTEIHEKLYKCPIGSWPRHPVYKDAGRVNREHWKSGLEGWAMWLLTKHGEPEPWSADTVRLYVANVRREMLNSGLHIYHYTRRVWARKPLE